MMSGNSLVESLVTLAELSNLVLLPSHFIIGRSATFNLHYFSVTSNLYRNRAKRSVVYNQ